MTEDKKTNVVKVRSFLYHQEQDNPYLPGTKIVVPMSAERMDELDYDSLRPFDKERADKFDVFFTESELARYRSGGAVNPAEIETPGAAALDTSSVQELAAWIESDEPTVEQVLELAEGDPELAARLLEAENMATGNEPRKGVLQGLEKIAGQA